MEINKQTIKCDVEDCKHYEEKHCSLDEIKVAPCDAGDVEEGTKDATMCDSFHAE